jgi:hypothetical protein
MRTWKGTKKMRVKKGEGEECSGETQRGEGESDPHSP